MDTQIWARFLTGLLLIYLGTNVTYQIDKIQRDTLSCTSILPPIEGNPEGNPIKEADGAPCGIKTTVVGTSPIGFHIVTREDVCKNGMCVDHIYDEKSSRDPLQMILIGALLAVGLIVSFRGPSAFSSLLTPKVPSTPDGSSSSITPSSSKRPKRKAKSSSAAS